MPAVSGLSPSILWLLVRGRSLEVLQIHDPALEIVAEPSPAGSARAQKPVLNCYNRWIASIGFSMTDLTLFFAPDTCARVSMIALEETEHSYKTELIAFMRGDHRSPRYLALNPKGKVPTLIVDGRVLTENVAILLWLAARFPEANLLPQYQDAFDKAQLVADLTYCASGLHPIVTRLRIPQYFCDIPGGEPRVFEMAEVAMRPNFAIIDRRLAEREWWYGDCWSVMDAYINWVWFRATGAGFRRIGIPALRRSRRTN
jgi:glutathione S-transferase